MDRQDLEHHAYPLFSNFSSAVQGEVAQAKVTLGTLSLWIVWRDSGLECEMMLKRDFDNHPRRKVINRWLYDTSLWRRHFKLYKGLQLKLGQNFLESTSCIVVSTPSLAMSMLGGWGGCFGIHGDRVTGYKRIPNGGNFKHHDRLRLMKLNLEGSCLLPRQ